MSKRTNDDIDNLAKYGDRDDALDELATLLAHTTNEAKIPTAAFKKARIELPSLSADKRSGFAPQFSLSPKIDHV